MGQMIPSRTIPLYAANVVDGCILIYACGVEIIHSSVRNSRKLLCADLLETLFLQRWANLWWKVDVETTSSSVDVVSASVLKQDGRGSPRSNEGGGVSSSSGVCEDAANDIGEMVGTIALFSAILLGILLMHVVIISGIEAYWLAKVRQ